LFVVLVNVPAAVPVGILLLINWVTLPLCCCCCCCCWCCQAPYNCLPSGANILWIFKFH